MKDHKQSLGYLTGLTSRLFNKLLTTRFQQAGIDMTAEQWGVIVTLLKGEPVPQAEIGELLYLEKSSVSRSIDGLEKRGWIERKKDSNDSRKKRVSLTSKAENIAEQCSEIAQSVLREAQQNLTQEQIDQSRSQLMTVADNLRKLNEFES